MKLWEVIKALEENSKKVFEVEGSPSHRIGFSDEGTLSWLNPYGEDNCDFSIATYDNNKYGSDNIHTDWQEVKQPVPWQEAIEAWKDGKTIYSYNPQNHNSYPKDKQILTICSEEIANFEWYIEEDKAHVE